jgi:GDP-4-dehydro-6-deoxy-D-mannose reductase
VTKRFLITGIDGFIGSWLDETLRAQGHEVFGVSRKTAGPYRLLGDITDRNAVDAAIRASRPDCIFHFAAQNNVMRSIKDPQETISINIGGSLNLLQSVRELSPGARLISVGSSSEYGKTAHVYAHVPEDAPLLPSNVYGITKAAQGMLAAVFAGVFQLDTIHIRPFAIVGPQKEGDALADFCRGIVAIERRFKESLMVGNTEAVRDFVDVRDCVSALLLICERGITGATYNICNGREASLADIIGVLQQFAQCTIRLEVDASRLRPADDLRIVGDSRRLEALGYAPRCDLAKTVSDTLAYWRTRP